MNAATLADYRRLRHDTDIRHACMVWIDEENQAVANTMAERATFAGVSP